MTHKFGSIAADSVSYDTVFDALKTSGIDPETIDIDEHVHIEPSNGGFSMFLDIDPDTVTTEPTIMVECTGCGATFECETLVNVREHHRPGYELEAYCRNPDHNTWLADVVITERIGLSEQ